MGPVGEGEALGEEDGVAGAALVVAGLTPAEKIIKMICGRIGMAIVSHSCVLDTDWVSNIF